MWDGSFVFRDATYTTTIYRCRRSPTTLLYIATIRHPTTYYPYYSLPACLMCHSPPQPPMPPSPHTTPACIHTCHLPFSLPTCSSTTMYILLPASPSMPAWRKVPLACCSATTLPHYVSYACSLGEAFYSCLPPATMPACSMDGGWTKTKRQLPSPTAFIPQCGNENGGVVALLPSMPCLVCHACSCLACALCLCWRMEDWSETDRRRRMEVGEMGGVVGVGGDLSISSLSLSISIYQ